VQTKETQQYLCIKVIMKRKCYDPNTYRVLKKDPTNAIQSKCNTFIKCLFDNKFIDLKFKKFLTHYDSTAPRFYGLPKIHKPYLPLRPVVSFVGSPSYALSKFISQILSSIKNDVLNIRSSQELPHILSQIILEDDDVSVSFDVVSLFTSVPIH